MTDQAKALAARLRQLARNTGKLTWVNDEPMPATAALHLSADLIETQAREIERLREALGKAKYWIGDLGPAHVLNKERSAILFAFLRELEAL